MWNSISPDGWVSSIKNGIMVIPLFAARAISLLTGVETFESLEKIRTKTALWLIALTTALAQVS
jgi:L-cystine uptake protein TcyP (sodium:dicarboxylate symporter family)